MGAVCYKTAQLKTSAAYRIPFGLFYIVPTIVLAGIFFIPEVSHQSGMVASFIRISLTILPVPTLALDKRPL